MKKYFLIMLLILFSLNIFAEKLAVLPEVLKPENLIIDGDRIYITSETITVYMYSMENYKFLKQFIKKGEGPKEAKNKLQLKILPNLLTVYTSDKVMFYSRDGEYIKEMRVPTNISRVVPIAENFIGHMHNIDKEAMTQYMSINLFDKDFNPIKTLRKGELHQEYSPKVGKKKKIFKVIHDLLLYHIYDGKIYIVDTHRGFSITVFDDKGNELYEINKDYKKIPVPESFKNDWLEHQRKLGYLNLLEKYFTISFRDYFPAISNFWVKNGKIYVFTPVKEEGKENGKRELMVLDLKGEILTRVFVHDDILKSTTYNDKFYYLLENEEDEVWELHAEETKY